MRRIDRGGFRLFLARSGITLALATLLIVPALGLNLAFDSRCKAVYGDGAGYAILARACKMPDGTLKSLF